MANPLLERAICGEQLNPTEVETVFARMMSGEAHTAEIAAYLTAWRCFPEYPALLIGGARYLRRHAANLSVPQLERPIFDNCGTGGSGRRKFNTSTAAAIFAASFGVRMAKHGNRSMSGRCGSADFLEQLGFPLTLSHQSVLTLLNQTGFSFFYAPSFHPLMKHVGEVRKALDVRTIFNLLGPLANPLTPDGQMLGVTKATLLGPMAEALRALGVKKALVLHADSGLDEVSSACLTQAVEVDGVNLRPFTINPRSYDCYAVEEDLKDGGPKECAEIFGAMLNGEDSSHSRAVLLNAAHLMWLAGTVAGIEDAVAKLRTALRNGSIKKYFEHWCLTAKKLD